MKIDWHWLTTIALLIGLAINGIVDATQWEAIHTIKTIKCECSCNHDPKPKPKPGIGAEQ